MSNRQLKKKFDENDKRLMMMKTLIVVLIVLVLLACFLGGLVLIALGDEKVWLGIVVWFLGVAFSLTLWTISLYGFSRAIDLKLIRNKVYNLENKEMKNILEDMYHVDEYDDESE